MLVCMHIYFPRPGEFRPSEGGTWCSENSLFSDQLITLVPQYLTQCPNWRSLLYENTKKLRFYTYFEFNLPERFLIQRESSTIHSKFLQRAAK